MDRVFIEGLKLLGKHGVLDHERHTEQEFLIDIVAEFDSRASAQSDTLADTIDYVDFARIAEDVVANNSFYLIERLADTIAGKILAGFNVSQVSITIRKPAVLKNGIPGITIVRKRT